jgi:hypothetical protein
LRSHAAVGATRLLVCLERIRCAGNEIIEAALLRGGIFELKMVPLTVAAREHGLAIKNPIAVIARYDDPASTLPSVSNFLSVPEGDTLYMIANRVAISGLGIQPKPCIPARRFETPPTTAASRQ